MTDPTLTAAALAKYGRLETRPVLASFMGGGSVAAAVEVLNRHGIPTFDYPDSAARAFCYMWRYTKNLRGLYETPSLADDGGTNADVPRELLAGAQRAGRTLLDEHESKQLLAAYGIPTVETRVARSADQARALARELGYPVVVKLFSHTLTHKTDVGGVLLDLEDDAAVEAAFSTIQSRVGAEHFQGVTVQPMVKLRDAYELILGSACDAQFGPVVLFGLGGQLVEVFRDRALALPPLNSTLALRLIEETRIHRALLGVRGRKPIDLSLLARVLVRFSRLVVEHPRIAELDINPLLASSEGIVALDARVVLHAPDRSDADLPRPSIRPYPQQYVSPFRLADGRELSIRPIRAEDEPRVAELHRKLSARSVRLRYFQALRLDQRTAHERLIRVCFADYDREWPLVVERPKDDGGEIVAIGRLSKLAGQSAAEFSIVVSDEWQHKGLGTELLRRLVSIGRDERVSVIKADILPDNLDMRRICEKVGFKLQFEAGDSVVRALLPLE
jgi:acetyltransferase